MKGVALQGECYLPCRLRCRPWADAAARRSWGQPWRGKACAAVRASRRCSGAVGLPDAACALARPRGIAQANRWLKPLYQGAAWNLADGPFGSNETAFSPGGSLRARQAAGVVAGEMLRVLAGCVAGVEPDADPGKRITVNAGSVLGAPGRGGGRARCAVC